MVFRYEAMWEENEACEGVIRQGWEEGQQLDQPWECLINKTKLVKEPSKSGIGLNLRKLTMRFVSVKEG